MAPRGIVAAATSSTFALGLSQAGIGGGSQDLIPITFIVIVATALIYGLTGGPVARALGVASTGPGGVLLVGSSPVGRAIGRGHQDQGLTVVLWSAGEEHARAAEADGLTVYRSDPTANAGETAPSELDGLDYALAVGDDEALNAILATAPSELDGLDYALAVSDDEALNAMLATDLSEYFSHGHVFQLPVTDGPAADFYARVPVLFDDSATHDELLARIEAGATIAAAETPAGSTADMDPRARLGADWIPMFILTPGKDLRVLAAGDKTPLHAGQELIGLLNTRN